MAGTRFGWALWAIVLTASASAQNVPVNSDKPNRLDLSVNYVADIANAQPGACGCFAMQGGGTEDAYYFRPSLAVVADVSVVYTSHVTGTNAALGLATFMAGPRYALRTKRRYVPYAQGLIGGVEGFDAIFPGQTSTSAQSLAFSVGGGVEIKYHRRISIRAIEAGYLNTRLPNNVNDTQNHFRLSAGVVFHLK